MRGKSTRLIIKFHHKIIIGPFQVSDFGLSIQASDSGNSNVRNSNFYPNRWSALETFDLESFSEKSDV